ncbi:glycosyltransferase [Bacteroidota bacterium]
MKVVISVSNDLNTDYRVYKIAKSLQKREVGVSLVGRKLPFTKLFPGNEFKVKRFRLIFNKGPLFYVSLNIRLFFYLLFRKTDIFVSNDMDTLPANYAISVFRRKILLFDSHELFSEVPELIGRKAIKMIWKIFEDLIIPKLKYGYTVSQSICQYYQEKYNINFGVVRNIPHYEERIPKIKKESGIVVIYQGAMNLGRGIELMIQSVRYLPEEYTLWLVGDGDRLNELNELRIKEGLQERVRMVGRVSIDEMKSLTLKADVGLSLEEDLGLNYRFSLPNKIFSYIQARIPCIVSDLPEMKNLVNEYQVGEILKERNPQALASLIVNTVSHNKRYIENLDKAAKNLCWEKEEKKLLEIFFKAGLSI